MRGALLQSCLWQDNADRNGAWNIASRSLLQRQAVGERAMCQLAYSDDEGEGSSQSQIHDLNCQQVGNLIVGN